jgi:3',5'-cyclic AMP phosphodiesterase CpdA
MSSLVWPDGFGDLLATIATVNDLHFGETVCGLLDGLDLGPTLRSEPGEEPYPAVMNRAAVAEIAALAPDVVVAKGDLTSNGSADEYAEFDALYRGAFGDRLIVTLGNHDKPYSGGEVPAAPSMQATEVGGVTVAVLDTARPGWPGGEVSDKQAQWLDELAAGTDGPVLVFGHHPAGGEDMDHLFGPGAAGRNSVDAEGTRRLAAVVARRRSLAGYFAGHTHRNKVRHLPSTGDFPWVEVACVKDFPGSWAEYRVYEQGFVQVHHRIDSDPAARHWSERCRAMFGGRYPAYALGHDQDRSFQVRRRDLVQ